MNITRTFKSVLAAGFGAGVAHFLLAPRDRSPQRYEIPVFVPAEPVAVAPEPVAATAVSPAKPAVAKKKSFVMTPARRRAARNNSGELHKGALLTNAEAAEIYRLRRCEGESVLSLSSRFNVSSYVVAGICNRSNYAVATAKVRCPDGDQSVRKGRVFRISRETVREIKALYDTGTERSTFKLGAAYDISESTIRRIVTGKHPMTKD